MNRPDTWGIDGDIIVYSVGFASEDDPVAFALHSVKVMVQDILDSCGASHGIVYLTGDDNYRIQHAHPDFPYKGNRKDAKKPRHIGAIREYMVEHMDAVVSDGEEADDLLGIGAVQHGHGIATLDKDLNGIEGYHYNWKKKEVYVVSPESADIFFYKQLLTGDSTDNIPGLYKMVGVKATQKVIEPLYELETPEEMYAYVRDVYLEGYDKVGLCPDEREQTVDNWLSHIGKCLWIRREAGELWDAPTASTED
jgi:hypothetical protein